MVVARVVASEPIAQVYNGKVFGKAGFVSGRMNATVPGKDQVGRVAAFGEVRKSPFRAEAPMIVECIVDA